MDKNQTILGGIDPEIAERLVNRREAIKRGASVSAMVAAGLRLGSIPVALATLTKDAFGQTPAAVLDVLQFAFILENLENEFYRAVLGTSAVPAQNNAFQPVRSAITALGAPGQAVIAALSLIQDHEQKHVNFLRTAITGAGGTAPVITANDFDFTGGNGSGTGPFARATTEIDFLLLAAQAFEDTGVRAYKGQAGRLLVSPPVAAYEIALESALRIHSVEARHAAKIRRVRRQRTNSLTNVRFSGYVRGGGLDAAGAGNVANPPAAVVTALGLIYGGATPESNTQHVVFNDVGNAAATIDAATMAGWDAAGTGESQAEAARMAFDEPLTKEEVIAIVKDFIKDDVGRGLP